MKIQIAIPMMAMLASPGAAHAYTSIVGAASGTTFCALADDHRVECWGTQLGTPQYSQTGTPTRIEGLPSNIAAIRMDGHDGACAETSSASSVKQYCWGQNSSGRLGDDTNASTPAAVPASVWPHASSMAMGENFSCALLDAEVWCLGDNTYGTLGNGTFTSSSTPVATGFQATKLFASDNMMCGLSEASALYCWGLDSFHSAVTATATFQLAAVTNASVGPYHLCAVNSDGEVWCKGTNFAGQLGTGNNLPANGFVHVQGLSQRALQVTVGYQHSCALLENAEVWCWGGNWKGELGRAPEDVRESHVPVEIPLNADIVQIATSRYSNCALATTGELWCWGWNAQGQLGQGGSAVFDEENASSTPLMIRPDRIFWDSFD